MVRKIELTKEEKDFITLHYSKAELSISDIARHLGYDRGVIVRNAKEMGLEKIFPNRVQGKKFKWTKDKDDMLIDMYNSNRVTVYDIANKFGISEDTVTKRARTLGIFKNKKVKYTDEDIEYIKDRAQSISIAKIANHLKLSEEFVRQKTKELGLNNLYYDKKQEEWAIKKRLKAQEVEDFYLNRKRPGYAPINDDTFLWDLSNPYYTTYDLGIKYDLNPSTIGLWRKKLLGEIRASPKNIDTMTEIEHKVSTLLIENFDVTYFFGHKIGKWSVDFYLGNKKIIEVQGDRWHVGEKVEDKDKRKFDELTSLGYQILYLNECDYYQNHDKIKQQILGFLQ